MIQRMIGAALFNAQTYEEIEADQGALGQAVMVVLLLVSLCGIVGGVVAGLFLGAGAIFLVVVAVNGLIFGIVRWAFWVTLLYFVGSKMLRTGDTETTWSEMGRVVGFAYAPGVLSILRIIPVVGGLFVLIGFLWSVAAVVVAVRQALGQALDFQSTGRAVAVVLITAVIGLIPYLIIEAISAWVILPAIAG